MRYTLLFTFCINMAGIPEKPSFRKSIADINKQALTDMGYEVDSPPQNQSILRAKKTYSNVAAIEYRADWSKDIMCLDFTGIELRITGAKIYGDNGVYLNGRYYVIDGCSATMNLDIDSKKKLIVFEEYSLKISGHSMDSFVAAADSIMLAMGQAKTLDNLISAQEQRDGGYINRMIKEMKKQISPDLRISAMG